MQGLGNKAIMSQNLRRIMSERKVSAKELSKALDFPYTTLLSWLKADNYPRIDKIEAMANYFGIQKSDLIEEKLTAEKEKDNDLLSDIIVRMRTDEKFMSAVVSIYSLDASELDGLDGMLRAFSK